MAAEILTIGYGNRKIQDFLNLLRIHAVEAVADVRSTPYSSRYADYNRESLEQVLPRHGFRYVFLGEQLGARPRDLELYENGRASYSRMARTASFLDGVERLRIGAERYRIAIMCAEKEPLDCHRAILIAPALRAAGIAIRHITAAGLEGHGDLEQRLLDRYGLKQAELFDASTSADAAVIAAYDRRGFDLAYELPS